MSEKAATHTVLGDLSEIRRATGCKVDPDARAAMEAGEYDRLDDIILARVEKSPDDLTFYAPILAALVKKKKWERAETVYQVVVEALDGSGHGAAAVHVARAVLDFWPDYGPARSRVVAALKTAYGSAQVYARVMDFIKIADPAVKPETFDLAEAWLRFDEGRVVYLAAKNTAGRIREINLGLGVVRVAFDNEKSELLSLRLSEALKMLEVLEPGNFFYDKVQNSGELAGKDPGDLLCRLFQTVHRPLTTAELKEMVSGIVPSSAWSSWWNRAKDDPRLVIGSGGRPTISWKESAAEAETQITDEFKAADARTKLELSRKHAGRSAQLDALIGSELSALAGAAENPSLALEMLMSLHRQRIAAAPGADEVLGRLLSGKDAAAAVAGVVDRTVRRLCVERLRRDRADWAEVFETLLCREGDTQLIKLLYETLAEDGGPERVNILIQRTLADPPAAPGFFLWLCGEIIIRPELAALANWSFLKSVYAALPSEAFKGCRVQLRNLFDTGAAADRAIGSLDEVEARKLLDIMEKSGEPEDYRRSRIRARVLNKHRHLSETEAKLFYVTAESIESKRVELERLVKVDIPENTRDLKRAKEHGDLSENFEYHAARARQELLSSRAKTLHDQLGNARAIDPNTVDVNAVAIGTRIEMVPVAGGEAQALTILGPWDSDPSKSILSYTAPSAAALLGAHVGDEIQYNDARFRVGAIALWKSASAG